VDWWRCQGSNKNSLVESQLVRNSFLAIEKSLVPLSSYLRIMKTRGTKSDITPTGGLSPAFPKSSFGQGGAAREGCYSGYKALQIFVEGIGESQHPVKKETKVQRDSARPSNTLEQFPQHKPLITSIFISPLSIQTIIIIPLLHEPRLVRVHGCGLHGMDKIILISKLVLLDREMKISDLESKIKLS
jgi:hypothetical protein